VEGADPHEFPALLLEHHVLADHINNVRALLDGLDRAGVEARLERRLAQGMEAGTRTLPVESGRIPF